MYALAFGSRVWNLPVAPESLEVHYPARTQVIPTLSAAYLEHFGPGVGAISLSGTTGWGVGPRKARPNGNAALLELIGLYDTYLREAAATPDPATVRMTFADAVLGQAFLVVPDASGLRVQAHKSSPMLRRYTLGLTILAVLTGGQAAGAIEIGKLGSDLTAGEGLTFEAVARLSLGAGAFAPPAQSYRVQAGDTYEAIAALFGVDPRELADANAVRYPGRLLPGYVLSIPS